MDRFLRKWYQSVANSPGKTAVGFSFFFPRTDFHASGTKMLLIFRGRLLWGPFFFFYGCVGSFFYFFFFFFFFGEFFFVFFFFFFFFTCFVVLHLFIIITYLF